MWECIRTILTGNMRTNSFGNIIDYIDFVTAVVMAGCVHTKKLCPKKMFFKINSH